MNNEEKEVKKTTKKTTTTKKTPAKKTASAKKEPVKKVSEEKKTTKKVVKKEATKPVKKAEPVKNPKEKKAPVKKSTVAKEKKVEPVKVEAREEVKEQKVVTKSIPEKKISSELLEIRKKRYIIEAIIIALSAIIVLLFLCNKTFLSTNYKTDNIKVDIPRFSYYMSDKDNTVKLFTLRKSDYLKEYYNEYLEGFIFYSCAEGNNTFYYNEETKTLIKEIKVEKKFIVKTIEITYDPRTPEQVCGLR